MSKEQDLSWYSNWRFLWIQVIRAAGLGVIIAVSVNFGVALATGVYSPVIAMILICICIVAGVPVGFIFALPNLPCWRSKPSTLDELISTEAGKDENVALNRKLEIVRRFNSK